MTARMQRDTETNGALLLSVLVLLLCLCSFTGILGYRNTAHTNEVPLDSHQAGTAASGIKITSVTYQVTLPTSRRVQFTATAQIPLRLSLYNHSGKLLLQTNPPTTPQSIHTVLPHPGCGTYYVTLKSPTGTALPYYLNLVAEASAMPLRNFYRYIKRTAHLDGSGCRQFVDTLTEMQAFL